MDFSQFLIQHSDIQNNVNKIIPKQSTPKQLIPKQLIPKQSTSKQLIPKVKKTQIIPIKNNDIIQPDTLPSNDIIGKGTFKKGDKIIMTGVENSPLNIYKGYYGEIKEYIYKHNATYILLDAILYLRPIKVPIGHFIKRNT